MPGFWRPLVAAGASVRTFNRPRFDSPLGWLSRDHRKSICVDGRVAYVSGLCVAAAWLGDPAKGKEPWRDTGVEIRGPAVADVERAFAQVWAATGDPARQRRADRPGDDSRRGRRQRFASSRARPATAGLMRLDQLIASIAR